MYSNVVKKEEDPPKPLPRKPLSTKAKAEAPPPQIQNSDDLYDDPQAPALPPKDPELIKECITQNGTEGVSEPPKPKERPVPQKRKATPKKIEVPPDDAKGVQPLSSPGISNPFYEETIPIMRSLANKAPEEDKTKDEKATKGKGKRQEPKTKAKKVKKNQQPKLVIKSSEEPIANVPVYELATAVPEFDNQTKVPEAKSDDEELNPTYITKAEGDALLRGEIDPTYVTKDQHLDLDVPTKQAASARPKDVKDESRPGMDSIIVDKYFYNFICTFKGRELELVQRSGTIKAKDAHSRATRDVELKFKPDAGKDVREMEEKFLETYERVRKELTVLNVNVTHVRDLSEMENELMNKFASLCFHVNDKQIDVVAEKKNVEVIRRCITKHGGLAAAPPGSMRRKQPKISSPSADGDPVFAEDDGRSTSDEPGGKASQPNPAPEAVQYPVGYDIGGAFHLYIYKADITTLQVDAIVNAANGHLNHGGGVAKAILNAAGSKLEKDGQDIIRKKGEIPVSQVVSTSAGNLPSGRVLHAIGPRWPSKQKKHFQNDCLNKLKTTFDNVFQYAAEANIKTIAIPPISSGIFRVPVDKVARAIFDAVIDAADPEGGAASKSKLKEVHIVDVADAVLDDLVPLFAEGGRFKSSNNKAIAVTQIPRHDIKVAANDRRFKQMINESPSAKSPLKRKKSFSFGRLCGKGRRSTKYN